MKIISYFSLREPKKHSVLYDAVDENPLATSIYIMKLAMAAAGVAPDKAPRRIKVTVEAVED